MLTVCGNQSSINGHVVINPQGTMDVGGDTGGSVLGETVYCVSFYFPCSPFSPLVPFTVSSYIYMYMYV